MLEINIVNFWMAEESIDGVLFRLNNAVRVVSGPNAGQTGSVLSLVELEPEPIFLVETSDGEDLLVHQSRLAIIEGEEEHNEEV